MPLKGLLHVGTCIHLLWGSPVVYTCGISIWFFGVLWIAPLWPVPFPTQWYLIRLGVSTGRGPNKPRLCVRGSGGLISARKLVCVQHKHCTQLLPLLSCIMLSQWQWKLTHIHQYYLFMYAVADINCHHTCIKIRVALMHPNFTAVRQQVECSFARLFHFLIHF